MPDLAGEKIAYLGYCGIIDSAGVSKIAGMLNAAVNEQYDSVQLAFSSPGGYIGDGMYLFHHMQALPIPVTVHNTGTVASIAVTVFVAAKRRICTPHGIFMMHPVKVPSDGMMAFDPLRAALDAAIKDETRIDQILRERTKIPETMLNQRRFRDVYLSAEEALEHGLIDEIAELAVPPGNKVIQIG